MNVFMFLWFCIQSVTAMCTPVLQRILSLAHYNWVLCLHALHHNFSLPLKQLRYHSLLSSNELYLHSFWTLLHNFEPLLIYLCLIDLSPQRIHSPIQDKQVFGNIRVNAHWHLTINLQASNHYINCMTMWIKPLLTYSLLVQREIFLKKEIHTYYYLLQSIIHSCSSSRLPHSWSRIST